jgi:hypothetical protein
MEIFNMWKEKLKEKSITMMYDRFNSDTEEVILLSDAEDFVEKCFEAQRNVCSDAIKDMNFTLAEIVRIADEPTEVK